MGEIVTKTKLENASVDCQTLEDCINGPADTKVLARLGRYYWTLATIDSKVNSVVVQSNSAINDINNAKNSAQGALTDAINDFNNQGDSVLNDLQSAINTIVIDDGVPALAVSDLSGKTQQEINNSTSRTYKSIPDLRTFNPRFNGERVTLNGLNAGSQVGGGEWYYDATDTTSSDNGWFIVVTNSGKRLKRVGWYNEIDLDWAGISEGGDLAVKWQEAIDFADSIRLSKNSVFNSPRIIISGQTYSMSKGVVQPPYLSTIFRKSAFLNVSKLRSEMAFAIKLQSKDNTSYLYDSDKSPSWNYALTTEVGKVVVRFTGDTATTAANRPSGIVTGNAVGSVNTYSVNCRVANFEFRLLKDSHEILGKDSWCFRFENCQLDGSPVNGRYGVHTSTSTANINSGERCTYVNCFLGGLNLETPGMGLYFTDCSADFVDGAIVTVQPTATYQDIRFTNCHFEMFDSIVDSKVVSFAEDISIYITGGNWLTNGLGGKKQAQDRILFKGRQNTKVRDVFVTAPIFASQNDGSKIVESGAGVNVSFSKMHFSSNRPRVDSSKIISRKNDFAADAVATLPSSISTTNFEDRNGNGNFQTTSYIKASPEKGTNCFSPQANASNSYIYIRSKEKTPITSGRRYVVRSIVEISDSSRNGKFIPFIDWFDKDGVFISRSDASTFTLQEYLTGSNVAWADRMTKLIPIVTPSLLAPVGAALAQHGVNCTNLDVGMSDYYLHSVILYDSLEN